MNIIIGEGKLGAAEVFKDIVAGMSFNADVYFGAVFAVPMGIKLKDVAIYNMEPLYDGCPSFTIGYLETLKDNIVLDYSLENVEYLRNKGVDAFHLPYGYSEHMTRIEHNVEKDIDVLFFGTPTKRRMEILPNILKDFNFVWIKPDGNRWTTHRELDRSIARSRIHLNVHHGIPQRLEVSRVNYLMANHCTVVSERGSEEEVNKLYENGIYFLDETDDIEEMCRFAMNNPLDGFDVIRKMPQDCSKANEWLKTKIA